MEDLKIRTFSSKTLWMLSMTSLACTLAFAMVSCSSYWRAPLYRPGSYLRMHGSYRLLSGANSGGTSLDT